MRQILTIAAFITVVGGAAVAQVFNIWGGVYNLVAPSLIDRQTVAWQVDANGKLRMDGVGPPPTCDGTIDFSTGCVQPMFRGL